MDISKSDARNGKNTYRQMGLWCFYATLAVIVFFLCEAIIAGVMQWTFGMNKTVENLQKYTGPMALFMMFILLTGTQHTFWINPAGNKAIATINIFRTETLRDGGTVFTIYTAGFALKWPWERKLENEIELEKDTTHEPVKFSVTVKGSTLEFEMQLSHKPHPVYLSSYLGNIGDHTSLIKQILSTGQQITEEFASMYLDSETVRTTLSILAGVVRTKLQKEADKFGFMLTALSYPKCDYSQEIRDSMDKERVALLAQKLTEANMAHGMSPDDASLKALLVLNVPNVSLSDYALKINAPTDVIELAKAIGPNALRTYLSAQSSNTPKQHKSKKSR